MSPGTRSARPALAMAVIIAFGSLTWTSGGAAQTSPPVDSCGANPRNERAPWNRVYDIVTFTAGAAAERTTRATVGRPASLDADADPQADLVATLTFGPSDTLQFEVVRAAGETDTLPVAVKAVLSSPNARVPGARQFAFGYDARTDRAPNAFRVDAQVTEGNEQRFSLTQQGPGTSIALVSSLVAGGTCTAPVDLRVDYANAPTQATVHATVGQELRATLASPSPGATTLSTRRVPNGAEERVRMVIDNPPAQLALDVDPYEGTLGFDASAPVDRIQTTIDSAAPGSLGAEHVEAVLLGLSASVDLSFVRSLDHLVLRSTAGVAQVDLRARSASRAFPVLPAGEAGVILDAAGGGLAMAARAFELTLLDLSASPPAVVTEMQGGRRFAVDTETLDAVVDTLPSAFRAAVEAGAGGPRLVLDASSPVDFVRLALSGADHLEAELSEVPGQVAVTLPTSGQDLAVQATNHDGVPTPVGQLRLAASDGSKALPAFVSDAQFDSNPSNPAFRDRLEIDTTGTAPSVALRLTAAKVVGVALDPLALSLQQDGARTRPVAIDMRTTNGQAGLEPTVLTGLLNKPSASTVVAVDIAADPMSMRFTNAAPVGAFVLSAANLGTIPEAHLSLVNIPTSLAVCMHTSSTCRPSDRLPAALPNYFPFDGNPAGNATAGGGNRPYPAQVSLSFNDFGTSGTSSALSSMVTLNATIKLKADEAPITLTNVRFHSLALDLGVHPTNQMFDGPFGAVPRIYLFADSASRPFVVNEIEYPPLVESIKVGTDSQPAVANRRLVWLPGTRCVASTFGTCVQTALDPRTNGSFNCGGQRQFVVRVSGFNVNLLNLYGEILPICT